MPDQTYEEVARQANGALAALGCPVSDPIEVESNEVDAGYRGYVWVSSLVIKPEALAWVLAAAQSGVHAPDLAPALRLPVPGETHAR